MSPRRPPQYPQFRGMVWKETSVDRAVADGPLAEWAYIIGSHPEGLERSRLGETNATTQHEVISGWFLSNFSPMVDGGDWAAYSPGGRGSAARGTRPRGAGRLPRMAPEVRIPDHFLEEEFSDVLPAATFGIMAAEYKSRSAFWYPTPPTNFSTPLSNNALINVLTRLAEAVERLAAQPPGAGHNSGETVPVTEVADATVMALEAVNEGGTSSKKAEQARSRLQLARDKMVEGAAAEAGKWAFRAAAEQLLPYLWDAIAALSHWLGH